MSIAMCSDEHCHSEALTKKMATDVDDDYGDEWGDEQAEDADDQGLGTGKEVVHPLVLVDKLVGRVEAAAPAASDLLQVKHPSDASRQQEDDWELRVANTTATSSGTERGDEDSLHGDQSIDLEQEQFPVQPNSTQHMHHAKCTKVMPPPPPCPIQEPLVSKDTHSLDAATLYARVAALRIVEYREIMREKDQATRREQTELAQRRKDVRRSNKPIYEAYGVANVTPADRLRLTVRALKKQAKLSEHAADLERKNRWYNKQVARRSAAAAHAQQLTSNETRARCKNERLARDTMAHMRASQEHLKQEAKTRISRNTCEYVRGSYLLKVLPANKQPMMGSRQEATTADMTDK
jgi:hypothetical protein